VADTLIASLIADGRTDSEGRFTIDRETAREKLRHYQLADPLHYLLDLTRAAVARGANRIRFDIDATDIRMRFNGPPFTEQDVDGLYDDLFGGDAQPARRCLATGLNAALALDPVWVRLESGALAYEARPGEPETWGPLKRPRTDSLVHIKERFQPQVVLEFFANLAGTLPEEQLLRERCRFAATTIDLEGEIISQTPPDAILARTIDGGAGSGINGIAEYTPAEPDARATLTPLIHDVAAEPLLIQYPPGFDAVVRCDRLTLDVSRARVVMDDNAEAVLACVRRAFWAMAPSLHALDRRGARAVTGMVAARTPAGMRALIGEVPALGALPLWRTPKGTRLTLSVVVEMACRGGFPVVRDRSLDNVAGPPGPLMVYIAHAPEAPENQWLLDNGGIVVDAQLRCVQDARSALRSTPLEPVHRFATGATHGFDGRLEVARGERGSVARFVRDGKVIGVRAFSLPIPDVVATFIGPYEPGPAFGSVADSALVHTGLTAMVDGLEGLVRRAATATLETHDLLLRRWLLHGSLPDARSRFLQALGLEGRDGPLMRPWTPPHPATAGVVFATRPIGQMDLAELHRHQVQEGRIPVIEFDAPLRAGQPWAVRTTKSDRHLLRRLGFVGVPSDLLERLTVEAEAGDTVRQALRDALESSPAPEPTPPPVPPPIPEPTADETLPAYVRDAFVRALKPALFAELSTRLDALRVAPGDGLTVARDRGGVVLDSSHPLVATALADPANPTRLALLCSAVHTALGAPDPHFELNLLRRR